MLRFPKRLTTENMEALFQIIKRLFLVVYRKMALQRESNHDARGEEEHSFMGRNGMEVYTAPQLLHSGYSSPNGNIPHSRNPSRTPSYNVAVNRHRRTGDWLWIVCAIVLNVLITCGVVFCVLYTLKTINSHLLCAESSSSDQIKGILLHSGQTDCVPCPEGDGGSGHRCCSLVDHTAMQKLVQKILVNEELQHSQTGRNFSSSSSISTEKCGALFHLSDDNLITHTDFSVIRNWSTQGNVPYKFGCIEYDDPSGKFTVNSDGFYILYSHLSFKWTERGSYNNILHQRIQALQPLGGSRYQANTIASDSQAIQKNDPLVGYVPAYNSRTMVIVRLRKGTVLTVEAKPMSLLMRQNAHSSFGLFRM